MYATLQQDVATEQWTLLSVWCPAEADELAGGQALRQRAIDLLPTVAIRGSSVPTTLVNIETIMWAATTDERALGTVSVVGQSVWIKVAFHRARWDYGDGTIETRDTPGNAYPTNGSCSTKLCDEYDGHLYSQAGWCTVSLAVTWTASFSIDGQHFQQIVGDPITGPTSTLRFHVRSARAVLVDAPR